LITDALSSGSVDSLIAQRLPAWFTKAPTQQRRAFCEALSAEQQSTQRLRHLLGQIPPLDEFAAGLLESALLKAGLLEPDVRRMTVVIRQSVTLASAASKLYTPRLPYFSRQSLLAAALHNYHEEEARPSIFRQAHLEDAQGRRLPLDFERFVVLCRNLDVGGGYQRKLQQVLTPVERRGQAAGSARRAVERLFEDGLHAQMAVAIRLAGLKGELDERSCSRVLPMFDASAIGAVAGTVTPRQLWLLGKRIEGVVTLELRAAQGSPLEGVIAWIPGDPLQPVRLHESWEALYRSIAVSLRRPTYRTFFARFISAAQRVSFEDRLTRLFQGSAPDAAVQLDGRHFAIPGPLFGYLRDVRVKGMFSDARTLAVPTGDEDLASRHARLQEMKAARLELVGLAGMFVPVVGELMLIDGAVQLAQEVYDGYRSWRLGDRQEALHHLYGVAQSVFTAGVLAGVTHGVRRASFVDDLHPRIKDGKVKLAHDPDLPHAVLESGYLLQGMEGGDFAGLLEDEACDLLNITGFEADQIRRLRVEHGTAPARLSDTHALYRLHRAHPALAADAVQALSRESSVSATPAQALLMRKYEGLSQRGAQEILDQSSSLQIDTLLASSRVPLVMAERARWYLRESRLDRACLGLRLSQAANADTERLALGLIADRAPWPPGVRVELRAGSQDGLLLAAVGAQETGRIRYILKGAQGYRLSTRDGALAGTESSFLGALLHTLEEDQRARLGHPGATPLHLRRWLLAQAYSDRQRLAELIGLAPVANGMRPLRRFADGRLGYALSGRAESSIQAIRRGIHQIYPTLSDSELEAYLLQVRERNVNLWSHYQALQEQLTSLRNALSDWQGRWRNPLELIRRRRVADAIRRCWRRKLVNAQGEYELLIDGEQVGELPDLPPGIEFPHVRRLILRRMGLEALDPDFLRRFANVTDLDLHGNHFTTVPAGLSSLSRLRRLSLSDNRIVADSQVGQRLGELSYLQFVELAGNPMGHCPALAHMLHLRYLGMRLTALTEAPDPVREMPWQAQVNARDNGITHLRQHVQGLVASWRRLNLHGNPLDEPAVRYTEQLSGRRFHRQPNDAATLRKLWTRVDDRSVRAQREAIWDRLREDPDSGELFHFLEHFAGSEDFIDHHELYDRRIWRILEACEQSEAVREHVFRVEFGTPTCADRPLLVLNQLEIGLLVQRGIEGVSAAGLEKRLVQLGQSLYRLDLVDEVARRHIQALRAVNTRNVDELEVMFVFRLKMAKYYKLPVELDRMHHASAAKVTQNDLFRAQREVGRQENTAALVDSLAQRPFWQEYVMHHYAERFDALVTPFHERLARARSAAASLEQEGGQASGTDTGALKEFEYVQEAERLRHEYEAAKSALIRTLAREAYERYRV